MYTFARVSSVALRGPLPEHAARTIVQIGTIRSKRPLGKREYI
jgi:hypothetical protein